MPSLYVVGFVSSPRKEMNTDAPVGRVLEVVKSVRADTRKIYLNNLEIKPCQAWAEYRPLICESQRRCLNNSGNHHQTGLKGLAQPCK